MPEFVLIFIRLHPGVRRVAHFGPNYGKKTNLTIDVFRLRRGDHHRIDRRDDVGRPKRKNPQRNHRSIGMGGVPGNPGVNRFEVILVPPHGGPGNRPF